MDQLPQSDRAELERILLKEPFEMTDDEVAFLRARRSYLTFPQKEAYKDILNLSAEELAPDVQPAVPQGPTQYTDPQAPAAGEGTGTEDRPQTPEEAAALQAEATATPAGTQEVATTDEANPYDVNTSELAE